MQKSFKIYFEIILDLQSCKYSIEFLYTVHPAPPNANILHNHGITIKINIETMLLTKLQLHLNFHIFFTNVLEGVQNMPLQNTPLWR